MLSYKYTGEYRSVTINNIVFVKNQIVELTSDESKLLKNSGFGRVMLETGELVEVVLVTEKPKQSRAQQKEG